MRARNPWEDAVRWSLVELLLFAMLAVSCVGGGRTVLVEPAEADALHDAEWTVTQEPDEPREPAQ